MKHLVVACVALCLVLAGCARPAEEPVVVEETAVVEWERVLPGLMTETQKAQQELMLTATNALAAELMGELTAALDAGDASAAIGVCLWLATVILRFEDVMIGSYGGSFFAFIKSRLLRSKKETT